jgi:uncharacterized protein YbgA (DUF1722 family)/uncharacterized protein YbbK (DUF523 family)
MSQPESATESAPVRIGISACLLGQRVRYDGGHKRDPFLIETVGRHVEWVPVCPELELGLGVPRETIRLVRAEVRAEEGPRLIASKTGRDLTEAMRAFAKARIAELAPLDLCGYVLKKDSPSCGMERVRVHEPGGGARRDGRGLFAQALLDAQPLLPVEEEGRLNDPRLREGFFVRVFAYRRLRDLFAAPRWSLGDLVRFHTAEKLLLMAHDVEAYRALGRLVAGARAHPRAELRDRYRDAFMAALRRQATTRKHTNVLQHAQGHLKRLCTPDERAELSDVIDEFRRGLVPLIVPITLLRHHVRRHGVEYLSGQTYLEPHPRELMLRNHV